MGLIITLVRRGCGASYRQGDILLRSELSAINRLGIQV